MKHIFKKVTLFTTMLALAFAILALNPQTTSAASKPVMKKVNVKWDLKNNKTVTYKTKYSGIGMIKQKAKISNLKIKNSKTKEGFKECTFTVKFTRKWKMSDSQIHKIADSGVVAGDVGCYFIDYNSGKNLTTSNKYDVTVEVVKDWTYSKTTKYSDPHGCWVTLSNPSIKFKVTYPKDYKGLCIGLGGMTKLKATKNDTKFWYGKNTFAKTSYYSKKDKSIAHFMRVK